MKNVSVFITALLLASTSFAQDVKLDLDLDLKEGESLCLTQKIEKTGISPDPDSALESIFVSITKKSVKAEDGELYSYLPMTVIGHTENAAFGNDQGQCSFEDGQLRCVVDCDGGGFHLTPKLDKAEFRVNELYYFPLFKMGTRPFGNGVKIILNDVSANVYQLEVAKPSECAQEIKNFKFRKGGC